MMQEYYNGYMLTAVPRKKRTGRWSVAVRVASLPVSREAVFTAEDGIDYILEVEAEKECINLGKNLIRKFLVGF